MLLRIICVVCAVCVLALGAVATLRFIGPRQTVQTSSALNASADVASTPVTAPSAAAQSANGSAPASDAATVAGEANRIGADPAKLLARVSDGVGYEIYPGVFRGSGATLADRVGNDADKALLLRDLLRVAMPNAGVRFASCALGQDQQNRLIAAAQSTYRVPKLLAEEAASIGGKIKNPTAVALLQHAALVWTSLNAQARDQRTSLQGALQSVNAGLTAPSPDVRDALTNHVWVQQQNAGQWIDLDPALPHAKPGAALCTAQSTMDDLPDAEYDTITASVRVEQRHGGTLASQVAVQGTWRTAQLEGTSLSFAFAEPSGLPTPSKAPDRPGMIAYTPILRAGTTITAGNPIYVPAPPQPPSQDPGSAVGNVGTSAVSALSDTPAAPAASPSSAPVPSSEIVGAWLELSVTTPGIKAETVESAIFDRVAFADRAAGNAASAQLAALDDGTGYDPAFESLWNIGVSAGTAIAGVGGTGTVAPQNTDTPAVIRMIGATQRAYYSMRRALFAGIVGTGAPAIANAQPGLSLLGVRSPQKGGSDPALLIDVASDHAQPASGDASTGTAWAVSSLLAERAATAGDKMLAAATAGTDVAQVQTRDVLAVFDAARKAKIAAALVRTTTDINGALPPAAKARLASSLSDGRVAFAPAAAVDLGGRKDYGWWIVGPGGTLRDEMQSGRHQAGEDAALNRNAVSAASRWHKLGRTVCFVFITMNAFGVMSAEGPEGAEAGEQQADTIMSTYDEERSDREVRRSKQRRRGLRVMRLVVCVALCAAAIVGSASVARADGTLRGEYFVLSGKHPDVGHGIDGSIVKGLVEKRLSPGGLPVVTKFGRSYSGASGPISDVNAAGELLWFRAGGTNNVRLEKIVASDRLPFKFDPFFPDGKKADGGDNGYLTVHWSGTWVQPKAGSVGFQLGSDDDSWVFVDGVLVVDNGGVKPEADAPYTVTHLATGTHRFDVFFADRHGSGASLFLKTGFPLTPPSSAPSRAKAGAVPSAATLAGQIKKTGHVAVYGIHFAFDRAEITKDSSAVLAEVAKVLTTDPALRLRIEGHTDSVGNAGYNRTLSQRRADAVKAYLVTHFAIAAPRLSTQGFGPDRPVATNATDAGRAKNRRVELARM